MTAHGSEIVGIIESQALRTVFQPVVDLDSSQTVGFEALTRGPAGPLEAPDALFEAARASGVLPQLDWLCRTTAVDAAREAGLRAPLSLLINAEPETLLADRDDVSRWAQFADLRCYCEVTERALTTAPGRLAAALDQVRAQDWGVAFDDVGVDPASLALLPLVQPDIIKLDLSVLHDGPRTPDDTRVARVVDAALTQAAETGAAVVAEGIETPAHLELARAYGVRFGQGFHLGRPAPLPTPLPAPRMSMPLVRRVLDRAVDPGPFAVLASEQSVRELTWDSVTELARQLLAQAGELVPAPVVLVSSPRPLAAPLADLVARLQQPPSAVPFTGILGASQPALAVTPYRDGDPARHDFAVAVVTAHFAAAVVARPNLADRDRYDAAQTLDRTVALAVATSLLTRV